MSFHSSLRSDGARINRNERPDHPGTTARIDRNTQARAWNGAAGLRASFECVPLLVETNPTGEAANE